MSRRSISLAEQEAGERIKAFLKRLVLRRRWLRLVDAVQTRQNISRHLRAEKERARREAAALTIFRWWKNRNRSFRSVALKVVQNVKEEKMRDVLAAEYDFSDPKTLGSDKHVDWQDMAGPARVMSQVQGMDHNELEDRLNGILGLEESIFVDSPAIELEQSVAQLDNMLRQSSPANVEANKKKVEKQAAADPQKKEEPVMEAATIEALVFFCTNPQFLAGPTLWETTILTREEWSAKSSLHSIRILRVFHCRYLQGKQPVQKACMERLEQWKLLEEEFALDTFKQYLEACRNELKLAEDEAFITALLELINRRALSSKRHHRLQKNELLLLSIANASPPVLPPKTAPKPWRVPHIPQLELARQITLNEYEIFGFLKPREFFRNAWNGKQKATRAPNVSLMTGRFNKFAAWVSSLILGEKTAPDRGHMIQYFLIVQRHLFNMNNFNAVLELHAVLSSSHIARLAASWKLVPPVDLLTFSRIDAFISPQGNYREYRKLLAEAQGEPCIPYLGAWLTDLTYLAEQSDWIERSEENLPPMLNVLKLGKIANILRSLKQFQKMPYPFQYNRDIGYYLLSSVTEMPSHSTQSQEMYEKSLTLEPRNPNFKQKFRVNNERGRYSSRSRMADSARIDLGTQVTAEVLSPRSQASLSPTSARSPSERASSPTLALGVPKKSPRLRGVSGELPGANLHRASGAEAVALPQGGLRKHSIFAMPKEEAEEQQSK